MANKRCSMFNPLEKNALFSCIAKYKNIVEIKKTDATYVYQKKKAWERIAAEFNSKTCVVRRNVNQLKRFWERQKSLQRKSALENCQSADSEEGCLNIVNIADEKPATQLLSVQPLLPVENPKVDDDFPMNSSGTTSYEPMVDSVDDDFPVNSSGTTASYEPLVDGVSPPMNVPTAAPLSGMVQAGEAEECSDDPLSPELGPGACPGSTRKRPFGNISDKVKEGKSRRQRVEELRKQDREVQALRLSQHRELHQVMLKNELDFGGFRREEHASRLRCDSELHQLQVQHNSELHQLKVRHMNQLHDIELGHRREVNAVKLKQVQLDLMLLEQRLNLSSPN